MSTPLAEAIAVVKARVAALARRPDVEILVREVGRRAPAATLRACRAQPGQWPAELLDFYELLNGLHVEWRFVVADTGGRIHIAPLGEYAFQTDAENYTSFGPDKVALRFDQMEPEQGTFWVAEAGDKPARARLVFAEMRESGFVVADTLAQYLVQAAAASFAAGWPVDDEENCDIVNRLAEPPVAPAKIRPGMRVHCSRYLCRGEVLQTYALPPGGRTHYYHSSRQFALLRLDVGRTVWAGFDFLKALPKQPDLYEQLRADPWQLVRLGETEGWPLALRRMGLAWGARSYGTHCYGQGDQQYAHPTSAPLAAGILNALPLAEAAALVQRIAAGMEPERIPALWYDPQWPATWDPDFSDSPAERKLAFDRYEWNRRGWRNSAGDILDNLISGLALRLLVEPVAARAALPVAAIDELQASTGLRPFGRLDHYDLMRRLLRGFAPELYLDTREADAALPAPFPIFRD